MNEIIKEIINNPKNPLFISITGIPGSGKSTLARQLQQNIPDSILIPMDGFHIPKAELTCDQMKIRGHSSTFYPQKLLSLMNDILLKKPVTAPSFDHALGDPVYDIQINCQRIYIFEGLYLALNQQPWSDIYALMDMTFRIDLPLKIASEQVIQRHVKSGLCPDLESAKKRYNENDLINSHLVIQNSLPTRVIHYQDILF